jgi:hypothetical protein
MKDDLEELVVFYAAMQINEEEVGGACSTYGS